VHGFQKQDVFVDSLDVLDASTESISQDDDLQNQTYGFDKVIIHQRKLHTTVRPTQRGADSAQNEMVFQNFWIDEYCFSAFCVPLTRAVGQLTPKSKP